jgi:hypothetical protein
VHFVTDGSPWPEVCTVDSARRFVSKRVYPIQLTIAMIASRYLFRFDLFRFSFRCHFMTTSAVEKDCVSKDVNGLRGGMMSSI